MSPYVRNIVSFHVCLLLKWVYISSYMILLLDSSYIIILLDSTSMMNSSCRPNHLFLFVDNFFCPVISASSVSWPGSWGLLHSWWRSGATWGPRRFQSCFSQLLVESEQRPLLVRPRVSVCGGPAGDTRLVVSLVRLVLRILLLLSSFRLDRLFAPSRSWPLQTASKH